jgi:hypothetical protein
VPEEGFAEHGIGEVVLVREDGGLGCHAVAESVELGDCFARFGYRSGGLLGVPAVGVDLLLAGHFLAFCR